MIRYVMNPMREIGSNLDRLSERLEEIDPGAKEAHRIAGKYRLKWLNGRKTARGIEAAGFEALCQAPRWSWNIPHIVAEKDRWIRPRGKESTCYSRENRCEWMNRREKPWSLEEDLALDAKMHYDRTGGRTDAEWGYIINCWRNMTPAARGLMRWPRSSGKNLIRDNYTSLAQRPISLNSAFAIY